MPWATLPERLESSIAPDCGTYQLRQAIGTTSECLNNPGCVMDGHVLLLFADASGLLVMLPR